MSQLSISGLTVQYPGKESRVTALNDFSLEVESGGFAVLLGPSGCGKSTALNAVAGLHRPTLGSISIGHEVVFEAGKGGRRVVPPNRRPVGMVFQSYALWPHLTVADNIAYPLKRQGVRKEDRDRRLEEMLKLVRCQGLGARYPGQLSGGQQQRVALARALSARPKLLLFDEPLSNLDAGLRSQLRDELKQLHRELGFTALYVTHDQSEALALGTKIAVMRDGVVVQQGEPRDIYENPTDDYVASFCGFNLMPGRVINRDADGGNVRTGLGVFRSTRVPEHGGEVIVGMHPNRISLAASSNPDDPTVQLATYVGTHTELIVGSGDHGSTVVADAGVDLVDGAHVSVSCEPSSVHVFAPGDAPAVGLSSPHGDAVERPVAERATLG